jgi:hypothetical protein
VIPLAWPHLRSEASLLPLREKLERYPADAASVDLALAEALHSTEEALAAFDRALAAAEADRFLFIGPGKLLATLRRHSEWPQWDARWERVVRLYRQVRPADAAHGLRHHASLALPAERSLWLDQLTAGWPHEIEDALFEVGCALLASAPLDGSLLARLCARTKDAASLKRLFAATAAAALRAGHPDATSLAQAASLVAR